MKKIINLVEEIVSEAFDSCGFDRKFAGVSISNRPDLCEYQCNGAMPAAKQYKKPPFEIASQIVSQLSDHPAFKEIEAVNPGFINIILHEKFISEYVNVMKDDTRFGSEESENKRKIIVDFGGANIAKPLHVGHLRSAIIGESIKRICRYMGHEVIGDVHLGDWGLQMGLIITELKERQPDLPYFDEGFDGSYPLEAPFTITELEEIYPAANARSKSDETFKDAARLATYELQNGRRGYFALWSHILNVSIKDLKINYDNLHVHFDVWKKESDAQPYIPDMVDYMKREGYTRVSDGALVVDVMEETDNKEIPPCMILKSDGATLYNTTDLATIVERRKLFDPNHIIYVVDKRQGLYFEQVFRCAKKTKLVDEETKFTFIGFGTMNGKDGKPFKTRDGGVMRLEDLISSINEAVYAKIMDNRVMPEEEARQISKIIGLSALKYGDLSNQATKDYVFDIERFTSFEGNTGPYILYTIVRIKSILEKYRERNEDLNPKESNILPAYQESEKNLMLEVVKYNEVVESAFEELAPHRISAYIFDLSNAFNRFYHETKILSESDKSRQSSYIELIILVKKILEQCIDMLGFEAPEKM